MEKNILDEISKECTEEEKEFIKSNNDKVIKIINLTRLHIINATF